MSFIFREYHVKNNRTFKNCQTRLGTRISDLGDFWTNPEKTLANPSDITDKIGCNGARNALSHVEKGKARGHTVHV